MKISVIGHSGSGKSSFAYKLAMHYGIEVTYLDKLKFKKHWKERNSEDLSKKIESIVNRQSWIIDGNYFKFSEDRFLKADLIVYFDFNRLKCLYGAFIRRITYRNRTRRSMTEGNKEKLDVEFIMWILFHGRKRKRREYFNHLASVYADKMIVFKNRRQVNQYLLSLGICDFKEKA